MSAVAAAREEAMGEKKRLADDDGVDRSEKTSKKEKRAKKNAADIDDAAAKAARKAAKKQAKAAAASGGGGAESNDVGDGCGGGGSRVKVSGLPPGASAAKVAAFLDVNAEAVTLFGGEAVVAMPSAAAAERAAMNLNETKLAGRFVQVAVTSPDEDRSGDGDGGRSRDEPERKRDARGRGGGRDEDGGEDGGGKVVEVECAGQTGRIIGKGGSKIREIEELTGCSLKIRQEDGICEVRGRDVKAAVQEIKNIVQEGRERDGGGSLGGGGWQGGQQGFGDGGGMHAKDDHNSCPTPSRPFGVPPIGSASRHDTGANDWNCHCGSVNFARRSTCFRCNAPRAENNGAGPGAPGGVLRIPAAHTQGHGGREGNAGSSKSGALAAFTQGNEGDGYEVFVKYLPHTAQEHEVADFFSQYGALKGDVRLIRNPSTGQCKGAGFVTFASEQARQTALSKDGVKFGGRHLSITVAKTGTFGVRATEQALGTHTPAMLAETIKAIVAPDPDGTYVDGTFGRGGHTRGILAALGKNGRLHAFDMDPEVRRTYDRHNYFLFQMHCNSLRHQDTMRITPRPKKPLT